MLAEAHAFDGAHPPRSRGAFDGVGGMIPRHWVGGGELVCTTCNLHVEVFLLVFEQHLLDGVDTDAAFLLPLVPVEIPTQSVECRV